ncbi:MAG: choline-sulfatase [Saprospiraceae bacterium]|jgi:choline-sulfatase
MSSNKQQNIVVIMADQLTAKALGCYGHPVVKSPNIDRLAREGVTFDAAYSSSPLCTPARYAFMTGQNISQSGGYDNAAYMPSTMPTFAHYLRMMGYRTCLAGKMHFVGSDQLHGFEERLTTDVYPADFGWMPDWTNPDERIDLWYHNMSSVKQAGVAAITNQLTYDDDVGAQSVQAIYNHARTTDERPLCLVASFIHPHDPYACRKKHWDLYEDEEIELPTVARPSKEENDSHSLRLEKVIALDAVDISDEEIRRARRAYYANISYVDEWVGKLIGTLEECEMLEDTTIMIVSDHGDMLGERGLWYKMSFLEWSNRIPLIIWQPNRFKASRVRQPVAQVDVLPTLVELAALKTGASSPTPIDPLSGRSLVGLCHGETAQDPNRCVSEYLAEGSCAPMLMIRQGNLKYIHCPADDELLYDLGADPNELINLAAQDSYGDQVADFRKQVTDHWDTDVVFEQVVHSQYKRRTLHAALRIGKYTSWDYDPRPDPSEQYTRSHLELSDFDVKSRYPRPEVFTPKWK